MTAAEAKKTYGLQSGVEVEAYKHVRKELKQASRAERVREWKEQWRAREAREERKRCKEEGCPPLPMHAHTHHT